jgi:DNA-directed RNA polymerase specialized sigma24 family protein
MTTTKSLQELIAGNLTTKVYDYLFAYTKNVLKKHTINLPKHLELDDIVAQSITQAYLMRDQYDKTKAYEVSWYLNIAMNYSKQAYNKFNNKNSIKHIPSNDFVKNTYITDNNDEVSIFDTLNINDETSIDDVFNESNGLSEEVRIFIKENNFDELYARLYQTPVGDAPNGSYRKYDLITYDELAIQFDINYTTLNNRIFYQTQYTINHFKNKKINVKERKIKNKTPRHLLDYQKEYKIKNKQKLLDYQKEYRNKNKTN